MTARDQGPIPYKQLALMRQLYSSAVVQSMRAHPLDNFSVLAFQDVVEMFFLAAASYLNVKDKSYALMAWFDPINNKLAPNELSYRAAMGELNTDRRLIKHNGSLVSTLRVESIRTSVTGFLEENTPKVFGVALKDISVTSMVTDDSVRRFLLDAERKQAEGKWRDAFGFCSMAFEELMKKYRPREFRFNRPNVFDFGKDLGSSKVAAKYILGAGVRNGDRELRRDMTQFAERVEKVFSDTHAALKVVAMGINYARYIRFQELVPEVWCGRDGTYNCHPGHNLPANATEDDVGFCMDFVIECSFALTEFDPTLALNR